MTYRLWLTKAKNLDWLIYHFSSKISSWNVLQTSKRADRQSLSAGSEQRNPSCNISLDQNIQRYIYFHS
jgi:hypothetical protein